MSEKVPSDVGFLQVLRYITLSVHLVGECQRGILIYSVLKAMRMAWHDGAFGPSHGLA